MMATRVIWLAGMRRWAIVLPTDDAHAMTSVPVLLTSAVALPALNPVVNQPPACIKTAHQIDP